MDFIDLLINITANTNAIIRFIASTLNLTTSQAFHLLLIPYDGIPMSTLAHKLGLDTSTLTRNIQKLETLKLVTRSADVYDKRIRTVHLTKSGISLLQAFEDHLKEEGFNILDQINLDNQEHIFSVLESISWSLDCLREKK